MAQQEYVLNGPKTFFFPFSISQASQVALQVMPSGTVVPVADYTVEGAAPGSIAVNVTWPDAPTDGTQTLVISRELDALRQTAFTDDAAVPARSLNIEFDHIYGILADFVAQAGLAIVGGSNITVDDTDPLAPIINLDNVQTFPMFSLNTTNVGGPLNRIMGGGNGVLKWTWDGTDTTIALQYLSNDVIEVARLGAGIPAINIYSPDPGTVTTTVNMHDTLGNLAAVWESTDTGPSSSIRSVGEHFMTLGAESPGPEIVFHTPLVGNATVEIHVNTQLGNQTVLAADWDGTNTSISLQHNGSDVLTVDENGVEALQPLIVPTSFSPLAIRFAGTPNTGFAKASGVKGRMGAIVDNIEIFSIQEDGVRTRPVEDEGYYIGGSQLTGMVRGPGDNTAKFMANGVEVFRITEATAVARAGYFGATPIAQPVLTQGTTSELITALGSTSGLGLVDDSASGPADDLRLIGRVLVTKTVAQSLPHNTEITITWDAEEYDTLNTWASGTDIVAPTGATFMRTTINAGLAGAPTAAGAFEMRVRKNLALSPGSSVERVAIDSSASLPRNNAVSSFIPVTPGDILTATALQSTGAAMDLQGANSVTWLLVEWYK